MPDESFKKRERAFEEDWANKQNAELIDKLRRKDKLEAIGEALAKKLQTDDPALLQRVVDLGVTLDTGPAFLLAPLVQVAWAEGTVTEKERQAVLSLAAQRGLETGTPAHAQLVEWLSTRPPDELFDAAIEVIKAGFGVLPESERLERVDMLAKACRKVAEASGAGLWHRLGLASSVSAEEYGFLDQIRAKVRG
ncbi:MAG: hypothetical protein OEW17_05920 [Gemmatimonadota bacterium]|nr:hypothetical protein [Gemmatimonadota bacterium]MDH4348323.1 hypothetical protein [Gemmatimonadota bacterium]MDH5284130.1 hypothetical protein [Gemmatimonadota bacterium]